MKHERKKVLMLASVASMIDQFNMPNIRLLQSMGYQVYTACNFKEGNTCDRKRINRLRKMLRRMGVVCEQWDCPRDIVNLKKCVVAYQQMKRFLERHQFAWLHCQSPVGGALARVAARQMRIPVIYTVHGFHFYRGAPLKNWLLYFPVEKLLSYFTDILVTVNREDYWFSKRHFKAGKTYYIPGIGIDQDQYAENGNQKEKSKFRAVFDIPAHAVVLLSVGELSKRKNHRIVIDAMASLRRSDLYYLICGQGELWGEIKQYADKRKVGRYVRMPGYQENMPWIYQNADVFVFPSIQEGMPAALMEAMAAGLPCVAADIRGNRELLGTGQGAHPPWLFSLKRPEELVNALERMLEDEDLQQECQRLCRKRLENYTLSAVQRRMKVIYTKMDTSL